jgi:hypothetical protein
MGTRKFKQLIFEYGWDSRSDYETPLRGYRDNVFVEFDDGSQERVIFYDVTRLSQALAFECESGRPFFAESGLIVLQEVTRANMETAAQTLANEGFFDAGSYVYAGHPEISELTTASSRYEKRNCGRQKFSSGS